MLPFLDLETAHVLPVSIPHQHVNLCVPYHHYQKLQHLVLELFSLPHFPLPNEHVLAEVPHHVASGLVVHPAIAECALELLCYHQVPLLTHLLSSLEKTKAVRRSANADLKLHENLLAPVLYLVPVQLVVHLRSSLAVAKDHQFCPSTPLSSRHQLGKLYTVHGPC